MKVVLRVFGIIAACIGIYFAVNMINTSQKIEIPKKYVYVSSSSFAYDKDWSDNTGAQYLGGDAYNYIVEASLKAGYYNATITRKTVLETGGTILLALSAFFLFYSLYSLQNCTSDAKEDQMASEKNDNYQSFVLQHLQHIEEYITPSEDQRVEETTAEDVLRRRNAQDNAEETK